MAENDADLSHCLPGSPEEELSQPHPPDCKPPADLNGQSNGDCPVPPNCQPPEPWPETCASLEDSRFVSHFKASSQQILSDALDKLICIATEFEQNLTSDGAKEQPKSKPKVQLAIESKSCPLGGFRKPAETAPIMASRVSLASYASVDSNFNTDKSPDESPVQRDSSALEESFPSVGETHHKYTEKKTWNLMGNSMVVAQSSAAIGAFAPTDSESKRNRDRWSRFSNEEEEIGISRTQTHIIKNNDAFLHILRDGDDRQDGRRSQMPIEEEDTWSHFIERTKAKIQHRKENLEILLDQAMGLMIIANTITIGISSDVEEDSNAWVVVDAFFALTFLMECLMKLKILGLTAYLCGSNRRWNILELALVIVAWGEIFLLVLAQSGNAKINVSLFRIVRMVRITRIVRVARLPFFTELTMMINGAVGGLRTWMWSVVLIFFPVYAVALVLRETIGRESHSASGNFDSISRSLFTVFRCVVAADCADVNGKPLFFRSDVKPVYALVYVFTLLLMTFGLFNVIVAIFVEATVAAAKYNDLHLKRQRLLDQKVFSEKACDLVETIWRVFCDVRPREYYAIEDNLDMLDEYPRAIDIVNHCGMLEISHDFFKILKEHADFQELLRDLDIADDDQLDLFDTFDVDNSGTLALSELVFGIKKLRGDPRRADVIANNLLGHATLAVCEGMNHDVQHKQVAQDKKLINIMKNVSRLEHSLKEKLAELSAIVRSAVTEPQETYSL